jgi:hypothetical protein
MTIQHAARGTGISERQTHKTISSDIVRQAIVVVTTIATIVVNWLANSLPLNGQTTGEVSDRFDVLFVPAPYVFSIWGLIYLLLVGYTIYQALPAQRDDSLLRSIGYWYVLSGIANMAWIFFWHYNLFGLSLVAMGTLLVSLIMIYRKLNVDRQRFSRFAWVALPLTFGIYLGWITVATIANVTSVLDYWQWSGRGIAAETWAVILLIVAGAIGLAVAYFRRDAAYLAVLVWATIGIAVRHSEVQPVATTSWAVAAVLALAAVVAMVAALRSGWHTAFMQSTQRS